MWEHLPDRQVRAINPLVASIVAALVLAAGGSATSASSPWAKQAPVPTPWGFKDVDMLTASDGWAVSRPETGSHGDIFRTSDGGRTWQRVFEAGILDTISFADPQHGIAAGNEIRYTHDGGQTWVLVPHSGSIYDSALVTPSVGYAVGSDRVYKTEDGGQTWSEHVLPISGNLVAVDFVDATHGWTVGAEGSVFRTTDGGQTWTLQRRSDDFLTGVSFVSPSEGWVSGNSTVLHTTDGGATWAAQSIPAGAQATRIRFVDARHGWAAGLLRTIIHTSDGGATWVRDVGGVYSDPANRYPFAALDAVDPSHAVALGLGNSIYVTGDGVHWQSRGNGSATIPFRFVRTDANHIWSANSNSEVLYSVDGGRHWERTIIQIGIACDRCSNAADLAFKNSKEGWAVINGEYTTSSWVWHTIDGGRSWQSLDASHTGPLSGVAYVGGNTLVAVGGYFDDILRSTDGGHTWTLIDHPHVGTWFGSVRFVPGTNTGWAVGSGGKILKSTDGGQTWTLQRTGQYNLIDVSFADAQHGWAVGGEELHTTDGGQHWSVQHTGVFASVSVYALSPSVAWIGGLGSVGRTSNGGASWSVESPSNTDLYALNAISTTTGWAGGQDQDVDDVPGSIWRRAGPSLGSGTTPRSYGSRQVPIGPPSRNSLIP